VSPGPCDNVAYMGGMTVRGKKEFEAGCNEPPYKTCCDVCVCVVRRRLAKCPGLPRIHDAPPFVELFIRECIPTAQPQYGWTVNPRVGACAGAGDGNNAAAWEIANTFASACCLSGVGVS